MAFKVLYHEDALADLEEIFGWSREQRPKTTQQFALDLFNHLDFFQAFPYIGASVKGIPTSDGSSIPRCTSTTESTRTGEELRFCTFGMRPGGLLSYSPLAKTQRSPR
jgi:plasmid stabilization system protein ParE